MAAPSTDADALPDATAAALDRDVAIVGGGPAGCSAGVFVGRYGLDAAVFDRGNASLRRCAHLENYPGFPGGVDVETAYDLLHDHAEAAGCDVVPELVVGVERIVPDEHGDEDPGADDPDGTGETPGFAVETQSGRRVTARRVVAATRYGGEYLAPLDDGSMFTAVGDAEGAADGERFDPDYADDDGRTPVEGLYVAAPAGERNAQAIVSAGHGAAVARSLLEDHRRDRGYPGVLAKHWDWLRREADRADDWREEWRDWFDAQVPDDYGGDPDELDALFEADVERRRAAYLSEADRDQRRRTAHRRLAAHLDDEALLESLDDDVMLAYLADEGALDHDGDGDCHGDSDGDDSAHTGPADPRNH